MESWKWHGRALHNSTLKTIIDHRRAKIACEKLWRELEVAFRDLERHWWAVDTKRLYTDQRVEQLSVLSELAAFASGFQMIMIFELELPALTEFFSSRLPNLAVDHAVPFVTVLLSIWGVACQLVACVNICILFLAMLSSIDLLNYSARESAWSHSRHELTRQEMLCPPGCLRAGSPEHRLVFDGQPSIDTAEQMHGLWCQKHDRRVALLFLAFNYTAPLFMFNIALSTLLKFYMAPAAGWTGLVMCLLGIAAWVHLYHPFFKSLGLSAGSDRMFTPANSFTSANASVRMTPALVSGRGARRPSSQGKAADVAKQKESPCEDWAEKHQHAEYTSEGTRSMLAGEEEVVHSAGTPGTADTRQDIKTPHNSARPPRVSSKQGMVATARGETPQMTFMTPAQYHASVLHSVYGGRVR